jgi:hypothetical protein
MNTIKYLRNLVWIVSLMVLTNPMFATNAPITTIANLTVCSGTSAITVPVTVTGFSNISSVSLEIDYDSSVMSFNASATTINAILPGAQFSNVPIGSGPLYKITIAWYNPYTSASLADGSILATLGFTYINGATALSFYTPLCEYAIPGGPPTYWPVALTAQPPSDYFINGLVSPPSAGTVAGGSTIYFGAGTGTLSLSGYSGSVLKWQKQYNDEAYTDIPNTAATYTETPTYTGTWNYRAVVQTPCGPVNSIPTTMTVLTPVGTPKTWQQTSDTDWKTPTNWDPPGTPMASDNLIIPVTTNIPEVIHSIGSCNDLNILNGASLKVKPSNNLKVSGNLTIEGP